MDNFWHVITLLFSDAGAELRYIIGVTLTMSLFSTTISTLIGMPLGILIGSREFRLKKPLMRVTHALMSLPPVVAGLIVYLILSRNGPLGAFHLIYSLQAMVIAQVLLISPIVCGLSTSIASIRAPQMLETTRGFGMKRSKEIWLLLYESRSQLISVLMLAFGRSIAEVGAVQIVGGNIAGKTRVMTTAIMLETNKGNFQYAITLGVVLLLLALVVNLASAGLQEK
ncbi:MAG: ABC transporter permease [Clostridia bacterium]|nr:ABC transporter permease [Clostridia bacterium]